MHEGGGLGVQRTGGMATVAERPSSAPLKKKEDKSLRADSTYLNREDGLLGDQVRHLGDLVSAGREDLRRRSGRLTRGSATEAGAKTKNGHYHVWGALHGPHPCAHTSCDVRKQLEVHNIGQNHQLKTRTHTTGAFASTSQDRASLHDAPEGTRRAPRITHAPATSQD